MSAIIVSQIVAGSSVAWVRNGVSFEGLALRVGTTHAVESYSLPPSTPFVEVEQGDGSHGGAIWAARVVASELVCVR